MMLSNSQAERCHANQLFGCSSVDRSVDIWEVPELWHAVCRLSEVTGGCRGEASSLDVMTWLHSSEAEILTAMYCKTDMLRGVSSEVLLKEDSLVEARCREAFQAVQRFETSHTIDVQVSLACNSVWASVQAPHHLIWNRPSFMLQHALCEIFDMWPTRNCAHYRDAGSLQHSDALGVHPVPEATQLLAAWPLEHQDILLHVFD